MRRDEFNMQIERLTEVYGNKYYPADRVAALFDKVEFLDHKEFDQVITDLIVENFTPPKMSAIDEAIKSYRIKYAEQRRKEYRAWLEKQPMCGKCGNSGFIRAKQRWADPIRYSAGFACPCVVGQKDKIAELQTWDAVKFAHYEPEFWNQGAPVREVKAPVKELVTHATRSLPRGDL